MTLCLAELANFRKRQTGQMPPLDAPPGGGGIGSERTGAAVIGDGTADGAVTAVAGAVGTAGGVVVAAAGAVVAGTVAVEAALGSSASMRLPTFCTIGNLEFTACDLTLWPYCDHIFLSSHIVTMTCQGDKVGTATGLFLGIRTGGTGPPPPIRFQSRLMIRINRYRKNTAIVVAPLQVCRP